MKLGCLEVLWSWMEGIIIFSGDVQTTSIAIAITTSVTCSLIVLIVSLLTEDKAKRPYHLLDVIRKAWTLRRKGRKQDENKGDQTFLGTCALSSSNSTGGITVKLFLVFGNTYCQKVTHVRSFNNTEQVKFSNIILIHVVKKLFLHNFRMKSLLNLFIQSIF